LFSRPRRDQRGQIVRKPFPAGYCHAPTAGLRKTQRCPISTIGLSLYQYGTNSGDPLGQTKLFWAIAGWCATTGGRQPFSFSKARKRPSLLVVAHQQAKPTEGDFLVERNSFRFSKLLADVHH